MVSDVSKATICASFLGYCQATLSLSRLSLVLWYLGTLVQLMAPWRLCERLPFGDAPRFADCHPCGVLGDGYLSLIVLRCYELGSVSVFAIGLASLVERSFGELVQLSLPVLLLIPLRLISKFHTLRGWNTDLWQSDQIEYVLSTWSLHWQLIASHGTTNFPSSSQTSPRRLALPWPVFRTNILFRLDIQDWHGVCRTRALSSYELRPLYFCSLCGVLLMLKKKYTWRMNGFEDYDQIARDQYLSSLLWDSTGEAVLKKSFHTNRTFRSIFTLPSKPSRYFSLCLHLPITPSRYRRYSVWVVIDR